MLKQTRLEEGSKGCNNNKKDTEDKEGWNTDYIRQFVGQMKDVFLLKQQEH